MECPAGTGVTNVKLDQPICWHCFLPPHSAAWVWERNRWKAGVFDGGRVGVEAQHTGRRARKVRVPAEGVNPGWIRKEMRAQTR